jgi:proline dehydrogenase
LDKLLLPVAKHFIAGPTIADAIRVARELNAHGFKVIVNYLGEEITDEGELDKTFREYLAIFDELDRNGIEGSVSVKLTQLGLTFSDEVARKNLSMVADRARRSNRYLWVDMEGSSYTSRTIGAYLDVHRRYERMGIAIQSYLRRTSNDVDQLLASGGEVRLCKGAYNEPSSIAFKDRDEIRRNYKLLMGRLFGQRNFFAIATHDLDLIQEAKRLSKENDSNFEFQMLKGVREELGRGLVREGYRLSVYLPYGGNWLPYGMRRIRERKRNVLLLFRALLSS